MKLENQVISLKLAKKLKKLGVKQESLWYWVYRPARKKQGAFKGSKESWKVENLKPSWHKKVIKNKFFGYSEKFSGWVKRFKFYSAFTVAELGERLPASITVKGWEFTDLAIYKIGKQWAVNYGGDNDVYKRFYDKSLVGSIAKMLIYLIENKLIKLK